MARYWASCSSGLQFALIAELQQLDCICILSDTLIFGGVIFSTLSAPAEILKLRSADNVYAFIGKFEGVPSEKDAAVLYLKEVANSVDWDLPLNLYQQWKCLGFEKSLQNCRSFESIGRLKGSEIDESSISYRVTCDRACVKMKKHGFTSMEAAAALGEGVHKRFGWPANMCCYDLEVMAWIRDDQTLLALSLLYSVKKGSDRTEVQEMNLEPAVHLQNLSGKESFIGVLRGEPLEKKAKKSSRPSRADSQLYSWRRYRKELVNTSLKPSITYALIHLGGILPGNIVLDPMCGCGTIPLEVADFLGSKVFSVAGDVASKAIDATSENRNALGGTAGCDLLKWNAADLPLRTGIVDRIVCDMPFGIRCGTSRSREWLCPKVVKEVARILRPQEGVAVLLGQSKAVRHEVETRQEPFLKLIQHLPIMMEGLRVEIIVVQRTLAPYYASVRPGIERAIGGKNSLLCG